MNISFVNGVFKVLNNDGKNPFLDGTPQCKLGTFTRTQVFSIWFVQIG